MTDRFWIAFTEDELVSFVYSDLDFINVILKDPVEQAKVKLSCHRALVELAEREPRPKPETLNLEELEIDLDV